MRALIEIVVVEFLDLKDALGPRLAPGDLFQVAEVPESLDPRSDHDEQVDVTAGRGRERVHSPWRDHDQIALMCGDDTVAGQQLGCPGDDIEQFAGAIVVVRGCPAGSAVSMIRWQLSAPPVALLPS